MFLQFKLNECLILSRYTMPAKGQLINIHFTYIAIVLYIFPIHIKPIF